MGRFAEPGEICPNPACPMYAKLPAPKAKTHIIKAGKTRKGVQRLRCRVCGKYFVATSDTIFYRKRTSEQEMLETLALLAEGNRISSLSRVKGYKQDTILKWLRQAAQHVGATEEALTKDFRVKRGQLDALWLYVGSKRGKSIQKRLKGVNSYVRPCWIWTVGYGWQVPSRKMRRKPVSAYFKGSSGVDTSTGRRR